jgi:hypothetical protein
MVRRVKFYSLAIVVTLLCMVTGASAAQNVANTNQKGSLLIWPKIMTEGNETTNEVLVDTIVYLSNDYFTEVNVKCYWVDENQDISDFQLRLTPNQPILFSAFGGSDFETGGGVTVPPFQNKVGELKCWAVNAAGDTQVSFNHLYGGAYLRTALGGVTYNAWSFTARDVKLNDPVGTQGKLQLTGTSGNYDACPQYMLVNFTPAGSELTDGTYPDLTLVPCKEDLRQDRIPTCTKAKFDIWNANETKFTGAYQCIKCWYEGVLEGIGQVDKTGFGGDKFSLRTLKTYANRLRVTGVASSVCVNKFKTGDTDYAPGKDKCIGGQVATPFVGLMLYGFPIDAFYPITGYTPHGAGADGSGFVLWDTAGGVPEAPRR